MGTGYSTGGHRWTQGPPYVKHTEQGNSETESSTEVARGWRWGRNEEAEMAALPPCLGG